MLKKTQILIGIVGLALLFGGVGYMAGKQGTAQLQQAADQAAAENSVLKTQAAEGEKKAEALAAELAGLKKEIAFAPKLEPYMLDAMKQAGVTDPSLLTEDLKRNPSVIPEEPVLGGTMQFTKVGIIDDHWVYGAYEDGHIAGSAIFQWEYRDSGIIWTPVLVFRE